jgi:hypothetical protein
LLEHATTVITAIAMSNALAMRTRRVSTCAIRSLIHPVVVITSVRLPEPL